MATLTDLIASGPSLDKDTAWIVLQVSKMRPSETTLKLEASVVNEPISAFRKKAGGLIRVGDTVLGAGSGKGYLDGEIGPWAEIKPLIAAKLGGAAKPVKTKSAKVAAPKKTRSKKAVPEKTLDLTDLSSVIAYNEEQNEKHNGPLDTRKTWINYAAEAQINAAYSTAENLK